MLKLLFAAAIAIQVVAFSSDASELALWVPGLVIGTVGLLLGDRRHFCVNDLFFILFLVLFVAAPADQLDGRRFLGDISVRGIDFPEHVLVRAVVLADLFAVCVLLVKILDWLPIKASSLRWINGWREPTSNRSKVNEPSKTFAELDLDIDEAQRRVGDDVVIVVDILEAQPTIISQTKPRRREISPHSMSEAPVDSASSNYRTELLLGGFLVTELLMLAFMVFAMGGFSFITDGRDYPHRLYENNPALAVITQSFLQVIPLVGLIAGISNWQSSRSRNALFWLSFLTFGCLVFNNPLNTARFQFGAYCLMIMLFVFRGKIKSYVCYVGLVSYLMVIMPIMNAIRHAGVGGLTEVGELSTNIDFKQLDYDAFSMFTCAIFRTGDSGFAGGTNVLSVVLFFVPRTLWPEKPLASSVELGQFLMQHHSGWFDNLSCPPFGDFYMDFGTFGVVCGGLLYGYLLRWSDYILRNWEQSPFFACGIAAAIMGFLPILVRGSLGSVVGGFVVTGIVMFITSRLIQIKTRQA
jgi:oligosaccharide repeat unit polymerase